MNVLHTVGFYYPHVGGSELVVQRVSEALVMRGHDVVVATSGARRETIVHNGVRVERFPVVGCEATGIRGAARCYVEFLERSSHDVMLNYAAQIWSTDLALDLRLRRPKVLAPCGYSGLYRTEFREYFTKMPQRLAAYDACIYHSNNYRDFEFAVTHGLTGNAVVIANGADDVLTEQRGAAFRGTVGIPDGVPLVITVGSHVRSKGHRDVIRAFRRIRRQHPSAHLAVIGPTPEDRRVLRHGCYAECRTRAATARNVHIVDGRDRALVVAAYREATALLFASQVECAPVVVLEAMAAGIPWISYDVGNVATLAGGMIARDIGDLGSLASDLLSNENMQRRLGVEGRKRWRMCHQWPEVAARYEALYEEIT